MIRVSEYFYSVQGEGRTLGSPAVFIRLQGCNLYCGGKRGDGSSWRCDTIDVWPHGKQYSPEQLYSALCRKDFIGKLRRGAHLIITGGEPLLQSKSLTPFVELLVKNRIRPLIEVETNGTISPTTGFNKAVTLYNVSPKLANSGMPVEKRIDDEVMCWFAQCNKAIFKFVIAEEHDFEEVRKLYIEAMQIDRREIYLMPACETREQLLKTLPLCCELAKAYGVNVTTRLQVEAWDKTTGV